jgi:hypothetical protein
MIVDLGERMMMLGGGKNVMIYNKL